MKKFLRVFIKSGDWADVPVPDNAEMAGIVSRVRLEGFIISDMLYIPLSEIRLMTFVTTMDPTRTIQ